MTHHVQHKKEVKKEPEEKAPKLEPKETPKEAGTVYCEHCHTEVDRADVCSHCGEKL